MEKRQQETERLFKSLYGSKMNFDKWFSKEGQDILRPNGDYVGVSYSSNDEQSEGKNHEPLHPEFTTYPNEPSVQKTEKVNAEADSDTYDYELVMGLEYLLPDLQRVLMQIQNHRLFLKRFLMKEKKFENSIVATLNKKSSKKVPL